MTIDEFLNAEVVEPLAGPGYARVRDLDRAGLKRSIKALERPDPQGLLDTLMLARHEKLLRAMQRNGINRVIDCPLKLILRVVEQ